MTVPGTHATRLKPLPAALQGALYMTSAAFCFSIMNVAIRIVSVELDPLQIAFLRNFFALIFMLPWLARAGLDGLRTRRLATHFWRAAFGLAAMICWFYSIALLPLAEAVALNFTVPLFATAGAALVLGEVVRARRWSATVVGFLGVLIILRPGFVEVTPLMSLPVIAACFMAVSVLIVKSLSGTEKPVAIVLYMNLLLTPLSLLPAAFVWRWPSLGEVGLGLFIGSCAVLAHIAFTRAFARSDASAIMPFDYARLPFVAAIGYIAFDQTVDVWTWVGGAVIAAAGFYIAHREIVLGLERTAPLTVGDRAASGVFRGTLSRFGYWK